MLWWKEPKQITHLDVIEGDVCFTSPKMLDKWYIQFYRISFFAFESLIQQIAPFITCSLIFVWKPPPIHKVMKIVLYILIHGIQLELMANLYNVGASIIQKYSDIVCENLANKDKFIRFIFTFLHDNVYYLSLRDLKIQDWYLANYRCYWWYICSIIILTIQEGYSCPKRFLQF